MVDRPSPARKSTVSFYGEDIIAMQELEPIQTYVPIARVCATLGLDRAAEERRVRAHAMLATGLRQLEVEQESGAELALCLRVELLPLWLATLDAEQVAPAARPRLELFQREAASLLWQSFKPQGFGTADELLPPRHQQTPAEQAYTAQAAMATLARHQMLVERQIDGIRANQDGQGGDPWAPADLADDAGAVRLTQAVRRVALSLAERTRRNEYNGIYSGLYRQFGIASYRRMPPGRLFEALEWLERWRGDIHGEPEPPPDI